MDRSDVDRRARTPLIRLLVAVALFGGALLAAATARAGQLGALASPGPLAKAHSSLEGTGSCVKCHEAGRRVTATRCLQCHQPIAARMAARTGVHRNVKDECTSCHVEHAGAASDLRHFNSKAFNHRAETGFPLEGRHADLQAGCAACHKTRSFLGAKTACRSCHEDVHKGSAGTECARCHTTSGRFADARAGFNHASTRFPLTGVHRSTACEKCHVGHVYRQKETSSCASCHQSPHRRPLAPTCTACHTTDGWRTRSIDHARTAFPLVGRHAAVACQQCHKGGAASSPLRFDRCSACHTSPHRESLKGDCRDCHSESGFKGAAFDHRVRTGFALDGQHQALACRACHTKLSPDDVPAVKKSADFGGASRECVACHSPKDPHRGTFGMACEVCHRTSTFSVTGFVHQGQPEFYASQHRDVTCDRCHVPSRRLAPMRTGARLVVSRQGEGPSAARAPAVAVRQPSQACATCHADVHLGQVGAACESCHSVRGARFAASQFSHEKSRFPLTGRHDAIPCASCHREETGAFPSGHGTATRFRPVQKECSSCHTDPHLGQLGAACERCHATGSFAVPTYRHEGMADFFAGFHGRYRCVDCHRREERQYPAGRGAAVRYLVGRTCSGCHPGF